MVEFAHIALKDKKQAHLLYDASFRFSSVGFTSICGDSTILHLYLAQILAGFRKPGKGSLYYNNIEVSEFKELELSLYRSTCTASLFSDFQILNNKSILDNICMGLPIEEDLQVLLEKWGLLGKEKMHMQEVPLLDQMKAVLLRVILRKPSMLVIYPESSPYSTKEWFQLYPYLKRISKDMAVIVVGDIHSFSYSDRILEIRDGYIISDSVSEVREEKRATALKRRPFRLDVTVRERLNKRLNRRFRWKFRVLALVLLLGLIFVSVALFSLTLNVANIEMMNLNQNNQTTIAIAKYVQGKNGTIYKKSTTPLKEQDVQELQKHMRGTFAENYYPQNIELLDNQLLSVGNEGAFQYFSLMEMQDTDDWGMQIIGHYPKTNQEVMLNYQDAKDYFNDTIKDDGSGKAYIGKQISWLQIPLTIVGIIQKDKNKQALAMPTSTLHRGCLYVKEGFHNMPIIAQQTTFQKSFMRIQDTLKSTVYSAAGFYPIQYSTYYSDGTTKYMDLKQANKQLQDNEILLSFTMALHMGFEDTYTSDQFKTNMSVDQKKQSYDAFAQKWAGKTFHVQAYEAESAPRNTTIFEKNMKIKGFLYPMSWDYDQRYVDKGGNVYMSENLLKPYDEPNYMIKDIYVHIADKKAMKKALSYLLKQNLYTAYLSNPALLQFFVIDVKELCVLLAIGGSIALSLSVIILLRVLKEVCAYLRKEITVYYMFGEQKKYLTRMYVQYFIDVLSKRILIGWLLSTVVIAGYILVIFFKIALHVSILYNLLIPLGLGIIFLICMVLVLFLALHKEKIIDEAFTKDMVQ